MSREKLSKLFFFEISIRNILHKITVVLEFKKSFFHGEGVRLHPSYTKMINKLSTFLMHQICRNRSFTDLYSADLGQS